MIETLLLPFQFAFMNKAFLIAADSRRARGACCPAFWCSRAGR
jgi:hypothetical protein